MKIEARSRNQEQEIFNTRVNNIEQILSIYNIKKVLSELPKNARVCDLFTGTGAAIHVIFEKLAELDNPPSQIVGVDDFRPEDEILNASMISLYTNAKYPLSQAETERNLRLVPTVSIKRREALDYLNQLPRHPFPFDLVTGFSVPLYLKSDKNNFEKMIGIIPKRCPSLFTFGKASEYHLGLLIQDLKKDRSLRKVWKFYPKPQENESPDWDTSIMINRNLDNLKIAHT